MARRLGAFARVVLRGPSGWPCSCAGRPRGGHGAGWPGRGVCREVWVEALVGLGWASGGEEGGGGGLGLGAGSDVLHVGHTIRAA
jgi:hypothetical protein